MIHGVTASTTDKHTDRLLTAIEAPTSAALAVPTSDAVAKAREPIMSAYGLLRSAGTARDLDALPEGPAGTRSATPVTAAAQGQWRAVRTEALTRSGITCRWSVANSAGDTSMFALKWEAR